MQQNISVSQLAKLVREMRATQNEYFRSGKSKTALLKSKNLEFKVDQLLKEIPVPDETDISDYKQQNLFL